MQTNQLFAVDLNEVDFNWGVLRFTWQFYPGARLHQHRRIMESHGHRDPRRFLSTCPYAGGFHIWTPHLNPPNDKKAPGPGKLAHRSAHLYVRMKLAALAQCCHRSKRVHLLTAVLGTL